eukprot:7186744-Ditylum_brightwellii.AAC.1
MSPSNVTTGQNSAKPALKGTCASHKLDKIPCIPVIDGPKLENGLKKTINLIKVNICITVPRNVDIKARDKFAILFSVI